MNLVKDIWLPIVRKNGKEEKIAIHQLLKEYESNPVMEILVPRPDFKNALYQLLIGIVQVTSMPESEVDWAECFENPCSSFEFSERVREYEDCFEIDSGNADFMQDCDLPKTEKKLISALLIEAPGENTVKNNKAHFVKSGLVNQMDGYWAAVALYTLQTFAPSGGSGHRVGLRGGGPLTTIIIPQGESTLWEKIWFNVLSQENVSLIPGDLNKKEKADIFPWMNETKISDKKGKEIFSSQVHPFYHFFGMPRRIRLEFLEERGFCDVSGVESERLVKTYKAKNYGNNYDGVWAHPLNAYRSYPQKPNDLPSSIKAQPGGIGYRHWLGQAIEAESVNPAITVQQISESSSRSAMADKYGVTLWIAGYDMDNMKARCWYESIMPFYALTPNEILLVQNFISRFISSTADLAKSLKSSLKFAWANRPKDIKGDISFIESSFWQNTEEPFYNLLSELVSNLEYVEKRNELLDFWGKVVRKETEHIFDTTAFAQQIEGLNLKRVIKARKGLGLGIGKFIKNLRKIKEEV